MFDSEEALIRIDMSEYGKVVRTRLIGAPGYVGYEEGGQLTEKLGVAPTPLFSLTKLKKRIPMCSICFCKHWMMDN